MIQLLAPFRNHEIGTLQDYGCSINWKLVKAGKAKFVKVADIKKMRYK